MASTTSGFSARGSFCWWLSGDKVLFQRVKTRYFKVINKLVIFKLLKELSKHLRNLRIHLLITSKNQVS